MCFYSDGSFDKYKCRIMLRGDRWYDLYCNKTYAGCAMSETVRLLLSVAATEDMKVASLDVKTAFLKVHIQTAACAGYVP